MYNCFYQNTDSIKDYILSNKSLYSWKCPKHPTDLSFFKEGKCRLRTITHEKMCDIYAENKEEYEYLKSIGIRFYEKEFVEEKETYYIDKEKYEDYK